MAHQSKVASASSSASLHTWSAYDGLDNEQELLKALLAEQDMLSGVAPTGLTLPADTALTVAPVQTTLTYTTSPSLARVASQLGQSFAKRSKFTRDEMDVQ